MSDFDNDFLARLDDRLCDALMAARAGRYDGQSVEQHLESIIEDIRRTTHE